MSIDDLVEAGLERRNVKVSSKARCPADIVSRAFGFQLIKEPEPFLGKRQRRRLTGASWFDWRRDDSFGQRPLAQQREDVRFAFGDLRAQIARQLAPGRIDAQAFAFGTQPDTKLSQIRYEIAGVYNSNSSRCSLSDSVPVCPVARRDSTALAKAITVGVSRNVDNARLTPNASPMRAAARAASSE